MRAAPHVTPQSLRFAGQPRFGARHCHAIGLQPPFPGNRWRALWPDIPRLERVFHAALGTDPLPRALSGGRSGASGSGRADGGDLGPDRGARCTEGPDFSLSVARDGYAWWYVDALSDDGESGLTVIAFIGSVFSPYYAYARRKGAADPQNHIALNVALYGKAARAWAMTERGSSALSRTANTLRIGPSALDWDGATLTIDIEEIAFPVIKRVKGRIKVMPRCLPAHQFLLDRDGTQIWQPIAPSSDISVDFSAPSLSWTGHAYFDHNRGTRPLEHAFQRWNWQRQTTEDSTRILYDVTERRGGGGCLALDIAHDGTIQYLDAPPAAALPSGRIWRVGRDTRSDAGHPARVLQTFEDTPFYARSLVSASLWGNSAPSIHESLDLDRFTKPIVQAMLPFRMPRRAS